MLDDDENDIELDRVDDEFTYSLDDEFAGTAKRQIEIESTGDYVVNVDSVDDDFVVAVGRDPADAGDTARLGALASGIAGIVLGLVLVLLGVRRGRRARRIATAYTAGTAWPAGAPIPTAPPLMGPAAHPTDAGTALFGPVVTGPAARAAGRVARPSHHGSDGTTARVRSAWDADPAARTQPEPDRADRSSGGAGSVSLG